MIPVGASVALDSDYSGSSRNLVFQDLIVLGGLDASHYNGFISCQTLNITNSASVHIGSKNISYASLVMSSPSIYCNSISGEKNPK